MRKFIRVSTMLLWIILMGVSFWVFLPPLNIFSISFWLFVIEGLVLLAVGMIINAGANSIQKQFNKVNDTGFKDVTSVDIEFSKPLGYIFLTIVVIVLGLGALNGINSRVFRAKSYANVVTVKEADFKEDFPESDISQLALLDRSSAKKIGDTYLGTIDKVSQFGISDDYRQITVGNELYRVSPLEYKSFWKWITNRKDGIDYYVKVNQTTGKAELVKLDEGMHYSDSEYMFNDTMRYLRFKYPTKIFGDPTFELDDEGNPYYIATTYQPKFGLSSKDPSGAVVLNAVTGETKAYGLDEVPEWVDRVYSANNVLTRVDDYYTYQSGFWNTVFSQKGVKKTTDIYNYITIGNDIYLYTGITSANADSSNLGFILVNMRTREITNYKLASATESAAQASAEGEVQEKGYNATAPTLVKLNEKAYYLISLKDDAGLVKTYALVDAEDYQEVTVNNDIKSLISQFTDLDTSALTTASTDGKVEEVELVTGTVDQIASQIISGSTVYYIDSNGQVYKVKATEKTDDQLPFLKVGDSFSGELDDNAYLNNFEVNPEKTSSSSTKEE